MIVDTPVPILPAKSVSPLLKVPSAIKSVSDNSEVVTPLPLLSSGTIAASAHKTNSPFDEAIKLASETQPVSVIVPPSLSRKYLIAIDVLAAVVVALSLLTVVPAVLVALAL